ncbi:MAG: CHAT domain-containing protein [Betaproteobacteria bacterium]|nr:CHAT domain-containing protein [Betaproteobacteria bacterium]
MTTVPSAFAAPLAYHLSITETPAPGACAVALGNTVGDDLVLDSDHDAYTGWLRAGDRVTLVLRALAKGRFQVFAADVEGEIAAGDASIENEILSLDVSAAQGPCPAGRYRWTLGEPAVGAAAEARRARLASLFALRRGVEQSAEALPQSYLELPDLLATSVTQTQDLLGARHPETLLARAYRAESLVRTQKAAAALEELEKVLLLQAEVLPAKDPDFLRSRLFRLGMLAKLSRGADAKAEAEVLFADAEQSLSERHPLRWYILAAQARRAMEVSDYQRAVECAEKAAANLARFLGPDHLTTMAIRRNLADIQRVQFRELEAIARLEPLLRVQTERFGADHPQTLSTSDSLARAYYQVGRWQEALPLAERVRAIAVREFPPTDLWRRSAINHLGWLYRELGRYADAEALLRETLTSGIKDFGESHPSVIDARSQYALALMATKRYAAAHAQAERAYQLARDAEGENAHRTLWMKSVRVQTLGKLDRCEEVIADAREANIGLRRLHGVDTMFTNPNDTAGARCASRLGRHDEAIPSLKALYAKLLRLGPNLKLGHLVVLGELGDAHRRAGALAEASQYYTQLVQVGEEARETVGPISEYRQGFLDRWAIYYRRLADTQLRLGQAEQAFEAVERVKGRGLLEALSAQSADGAGVLSAEENARLRELRAELARQEKLAAQTSADNPKHAEVSHAKAQAALRLRAYRDELGRLHPKYELLTRIRPRGVSDAAQLIPADTAFLSFAVVDDEVLVFAYTRERGLESNRVLVPGGVTELVRAYRSFFSPQSGEVKPLVWGLPNGQYRLSYVRPHQDAREVRSPDALGRHLGSLLLGPVAPALRAKTKWIVSPDRALALLPFETLLFGAAPVQAKHELRYIQSLSVLAQLRNQAARPRAPESLLAMGDPNYGVSLASTNAAPSVRTLRGADDSAGDNKPQRHWPQLPGTAVEVERSAQAFPAERRLVYLRDAASEERLQALDSQGDLARYRYVLFATHALLNTESPQLSSVVLAQNAVSPQADGYVTAVEWLNYRLASDLVVLSGCETALGQDVFGEGVTGLPYAMMVAGARNALLTLWRIDDRVAARFVPRVVAGVKSGLSPASAVHAAKRAMLRDPNFSSPRHWAAFVLYGS